MSEPKIFNDAFLAMGTQCEVVLLGIEEQEARDVFANVKAEVERIEELLNRFLPDSAINKLMASPPGQWVPVDNELWDLLTICYDFYQISNGAFDITVAPLVSLWEEKENPLPQEIADTKLLCGFDKLELDFDKQKIRLLQPGIEMDFGALEQAYAIERLKPMLMDWGIKDAIVSFGEDTVLALGKHPSGNAWPIGIRNQMQPMDFVHVFDACGHSICSFGEADKPGISEEASKTYTISPDEGYAVTEPLTVSVKTDSAMIGAFLATCWLILEENDREILSENFKAVEVFEAHYSEKDVRTRLSILGEQHN